MSVRDKFVERFGEAEALAMEGAAQHHENGVNSERKGSDPFKWVLAITIGYQCFEVDRYRSYHGITAPFQDIKLWIKEHGEMQTHDGDCDYLALFAGCYNDYVAQP